MQTFVSPRPLKRAELRREGAIVAATCSFLGSSVFTARQKGWSLIAERVRAPREAHPTFQHQPICAGSICRRYRVRRAHSRSIALVHLVLKNALDRTDGARRHVLLQFRHRRVIMDCPAWHAAAPTASKAATQAASAATQAASAATGEVCRSSAAAAEDSDTSHGARRDHRREPHVLVWHVSDAECRLVAAVANACRIPARRPRIRAAACVEPRAAAAAAGWCTAATTAAGWCSAISSARSCH